jgi:hypothetical protein
VCYCGSSSKQITEDKKAIESEFYGLSTEADRDAFLRQYRDQIISAIGADNYNSLVANKSKNLITYNYNDNVLSKYLPNAYK